MTIEIANHNLCLLRFKVRCFIEVELYIRCGLYKELTLHLSNSDVMISISSFCSTKTVSILIFDRTSMCMVCDSYQSHSFYTRVVCDYDVCRDVFPAQIENVTF